MTYRLSDIGNRDPTVLSISYDFTAYKYVYTLKKLISSVETYKDVYMMKRVNCNISDVSPEKDIHLYADDLAPDQLGLRSTRSAYI